MTKAPVVSERLNLNQRVCPSCNKSRPIHLYKPDARTKDGLAKECTHCKDSKKNRAGGMISNVSAFYEGA